MGLLPLDGGRGTRMIRLANPETETDRLLSVWLPVLFSHQSTRRNPGRIGAVQLERGVGGPFSKTASPRATHLPMVRLWCDFARRVQGSEMTGSQGKLQVYSG